MRTIIISALVCLSLTVNIQAQESSASQKERFLIKAPRVPYHQVAGVHRYRHASTVGQSYLDGMANLTVARGQAHHYHALARLTATQANRNRQVLKMEALQDKLQLRENHKRKKTEEQQERAKRNAKRRTEREAILANVDMNWPEALTTEAYVANCRQIELLVGKQATLEGRRADVGAKSVQAAAKTLASIVNADEKDDRISEADSQEARKFLFTIYKNAQRPTANTFNLLANN